MAYATTADYERYGDGQIPVDQMDKALERSSDQIDILTYNRIIGTGFDNLTQFQRDRVIKAVCQQADFQYQYGEYLDFPLAGYSAGSVSLSFKAVEGAGGVRTTDSVINLLRATGLSDRRLC